jgi:hypothetical protein
MRCACLLYLEQPRETLAQARREALAKRDGTSALGERAMQ